MYVAIQTVPHVETSGAVNPDGTCKFVGYVAGSATTAVLIAGCATDVDVWCEVPDVDVWCWLDEPDVWCCAGCEAGVEWCSGVTFT